MLNPGKAGSRARSSVSPPKAMWLPWAKSRTDTAERGWVQRVMRWPDLPAVLCFSLLSFVPITWFHGDNYISAGDFGWPLNWLRYLHVSAYAWDATVTTGYAATRQVAVLPFAVLGALVQDLGVPGPIFEQCMFAIWFGSCGLCMYLLARVIGLSRLTAIGAGLFYTLNTFCLLGVWALSDGILIPFYTFLPLFLALFLRSYRGRLGLRYALLTNLLLLLSSMPLAFTNPTFPAMMWSMAAICFGYDVITKEVDRQALRSATLFTVCWFVINAFWIAPLIADVSQQAGLAANATISDGDTLRLNSVAGIDALRLTGLWSMYQGVGIDAFYPWATTMFTLLFEAISFIPPILIGIALARGPARHRSIPLFGPLFLIGVYLSALPFMPGGARIINGLDTHVPSIVRAFRGGFLKFGFFLPLGAAPLVGVGLEALYGATCRLISRLGGFICWTGTVALICGVLVFPFWTGDVISAGGHEYLPSWRVHLPDAYSQLQTITQGVQQQSRLLALPLPKTYNLNYSWGRNAQGQIQGYNGGDFLRWVSALPVIYNVGVDGSGLVEALGRDVGSFASLDAFNRTMGLLNVALVLLHQDLNPLTDYQILTHALAMNRLREQLRGQLQNLGPYSLYRVPSRYLLPVVYAPRFLVNSGATAEDLLTTMRNSSLATFKAPAFAPLTPPSSSLLKTQRDSINRTLRAVKALGPLRRQKRHLIVPLSPPVTLSFRRVNPTEYDVTVHGSAGQPFLLILGEQFDPGWHAYIVPSAETDQATVSCNRHQSVVALAGAVQQCPEASALISYQQLANTLRRPVPEAQHIPANAFANGWVITPRDAHNQASFTIVLDYALQRHVLAGVAITVLAVGMALLVGLMTIRSMFFRRSAAAIRNASHTQNVINK